MNCSISCASSPARSRAPAYQAIGTARICDRCRLRPSGPVVSADNARACHNRISVDLRPLNGLANFRLMSASIWLWLYFSEALAVTDSGEYRHLHDCALATVRTAPSKRQRGSRRRAMAIAVGMLHWWHSLEGQTLGQPPPSKALADLRPTRSAKCRTDYWTSLARRRLNSASVIDPAFLRRSSFSISSAALNPTTRRRIDY